MSKKNEVVNSGLDDIFGGGKKTKSKEKIKVEAKVKKAKAQVSFQHDAETLTLLNELVWLKQFVIDQQAFSQGDVVRLALDDLAKKMKYSELREIHKEKLDAYKPKQGRKKG